MPFSNQRLKEQSTPVPPLNDDKVEELIAEYRSQRAYWTQYAFKYQAFIENFELDAPQLNSGKLLMIHLCSQLAKPTQPLRYHAAEAYKQAKQHL
jgi:hypothetical protein